MKEQVKLSIPAQAPYLSVVRLTASSLATTLGFDIEMLEDIRVCVSEACNNVMERQDEIELRFTAKENHLSIDVDGFSEPQSEASKMGMLIIQSLMDVVVKTPEGIHMEKAKETDE